jgi:hypothetical protein
VENDGPYLSLVVVTKHDTNPGLFNTKFRLNFGDAHNISNETPAGAQHQSLLIGRSSACNMILDYRTVSTVHARLFFENGSFYLQDNHSSNGTMVYLKDPYHLQYAQTVRIRTGRSTLILQAKRSWTASFQEMISGRSPIFQNGSSSTSASASSTLRPFGRIGGSTGSGSGSGSGTGTGIGIVEANAGQPASVPSLSSFASASLYSPASSIRPTPNELFGIMIRTTTAPSPSSSHRAKNILSIGEPEPSYYFDKDASLSQSEAEAYFDSLVADPKPKKNEGSSPIKETSSSSFKLDSPAEVKIMSNSEKDVYGTDDKGEMEKVSCITDSKLLLEDIKTGEFDAISEAKGGDDKGDYDKY